jgi:hypothetical protein
MTPELLFQFSRDYSGQTISWLWDQINEDVAKWGRRTYLGIDQYFKKHPSEQTAIQLEGLNTDILVKGEPVYLLLGMARYRREDREAKPQFVCFVGSKEQVNTEKDRIFQDIQAEGARLNARTTIVEEHLG